VVAGRSHRGGRLRWGGGAYRGSERYAAPAVPRGTPRRVAAAGRGSRWWWWVGGAVPVDVAESPRFDAGGSPDTRGGTPPNVGRQGPRGAAVRSRWVGGSWPKRRSPGGSTPYPQYRKWPVAGTHQKKKLFLIKITYESFPATVKADRTRWVYEWGGCKATRKS
jgi:hypothetical protein